MLCPDEKIDLRFRLVAQLSHLGSEEGRRLKIRKKVRGRAARAVRRQKDQLIQELDCLDLLQEERELPSEECKQWWLTKWMRSL